MSMPCASMVASRSATVVAMFRSGRSDGPPNLQAHQRQGFGHRAVRVHVDHPGAPARDDGLAATGLRARGA